MDNLFKLITKYCLLTLLGHRPPMHPKRGVTNSSRDEVTQILNIFSFFSLFVTSFSQSMKNQYQKTRFALVRTSSTQQLKKTKIQS